MFGFVRGKVKVFISSRSEGKYAVVRKAVRSMLEETNLCEVYAFEDAGGTTQAVITSYLNHVAETDVIIVLIDNKDGVSDHVQREVNRAREMKKKCFFFFCDEDEKKPTQLQEDLKNKGIQYCPIIHEFSDIPEKVYQSVIQEIVDIYQEYCRRDNTQMTNMVDTTQVDIHPLAEETKQRQIETASVGNSAKDPENIDRTLYLSRKLFDGFPMTYGALFSACGLSNASIDIPQEEDVVLSHVLKIVLLDEDVSDDYLSKYRSWVLSKHQANKYTLEAIGYRINGFIEYLHGNLDGFLKHIEGAHIYAQKYKSIPNWLKDDIAVDYRNAQLLKTIQTGGKLQNTEGQQYLDQLDRVLIYPNIDRFSSEIYKNTIRQQIEKDLKSPYTTYMSSPKEALKKIANIFIIAAQNASYTYMMIIKDILLDLCIQGTYNKTAHNQLLYSIKRLLEIGDEKKLKDYYSVNDSSTGRINKEDISSIIQSINRIPFKYNRIRSQMLLLQLFSYYMDEKCFNSFYSSVKDNIFAYMDGGKSFDTDYMLNRMSQVYIGCQYRVDVEEILSYILKITSFKLSDHQYESIYKLIGSLNTLKQLDHGERQSLIDLLKKNIDKAQPLSPSFENALMNVRISFGDQAEELDEIVESIDKDFYSEQYTLNVFQHTELKDWDYIHKLIHKIEKDNNRENKNDNNMYSFTSNRYYYTVGQIIVYENIHLPEPEITRIIKAAFRTLKSAGRLYEEKIEAIILLQIMYITHPIYGIIRKHIEDAKTDANLFVAKNRSFDIAYNNDLLFVEWQLLCELAERTDRNILHDFKTEFASMITKAIDMNDASKIACLNYIEMIAMSKTPSVPKDLFLEMVWVLLLIFEKSNQAEIIYLVARIHTYIINTENQYKEQSLNRLSIIMDNCGYKTKTMILEELSVFQGRHSTVDAIFQKGRVDNHYVVRKLANGEKIK